MRRPLSLVYKALRAGFRHVLRYFDWSVSRLFFFLENVETGSFSTQGIPFISVARTAKFKFGDGLSLNNSLPSNPIGRNQRCMFVVGPGASLQIGKNVGISSAALVAHCEIIIGDDVKIGGGVCIYDTDFHSLSSHERKSVLTDRAGTRRRAVCVGEGAFIGAHSTILKGVTIGGCSIVGAGSVVANDIPSGEIWAGNPAKFIRKVS